MKNLLKKLKVNNTNNNYIIMFTCLSLNVVALLVFYLTLKVKISFFGVLTDILFLALVYFLINLIKNVRAKKILYTIFVSLTMLALMADSTYFYKYKSFASISSLMFVNNIVGQKYGINLPLTCYILIPILIINLFVVWYTKISSPEKKTKTAKANIAMALVAAILCTSVYVPYSIYNIVKAKSYDGYVAEYVHSKSFLYNDLYSSLKFVETFGYCNFRIRDAASLDSDLDYKDVNDLDQYFNSVNNIKQANDWTQKYQDYNVITILSETFDQRFCDPEYLGYQLVNNTSLYRDKDAKLNPITVGDTVSSMLTPNIYAIRQDALTFNNYYVPTFFEGATINTEFMVNNGIYALNAKNFSSNLGDTYYNNYFGKYSLAAQFENVGYETYYFHNDSGEFYNRKTLTENEGFDITRFDEDLIAAGTKTEKVYDTRLLEFFELDDIKESLQTQKENKKSFYMQLDTYSMHLGNELKYDHHEEQVRRAFEAAGINYDKINPQIQCYYLKMVEFDKFLGMLIDKLEGLGILDNTLVVMYPDHYNYGLNPNIMEDFIGVDSFDKEVHHQKLLVLDGKDWNNASQDKKEINTLSSSIDLAPTILNMVVGVENAQYKYFFGKDIFDQGDKLVAFSDITVFDGEMYLYADGSYIYTGYDILSEEELKVKYDVLSEKQIDIIKKFQVSKAVLEMDYYRHLA